MGRGNFQSPMLTNVDTADNPYVVYALVAVTVLGIIFGALNKGTDGFVVWLNSLRRIGADSKAADIISRDTQIQNLSKDLDTERRARQSDKLRFEQELIARDIAQDKRDDQIRDHINWDWKVYNVLVQAGLLDSDSKPPPLH